MSSSGTVSCGFCGNPGHNQRSCPAIKANAEKVVEAAKAAGVNPLESEEVWRTYSNGKFPEEISYREMWAYDKHLEKKATSSKPRACSWCYGYGHNKRSCQRRKDDQVKLRQALAFQHKLAQRFAEAKGIIPGNLITNTKYRESWSHPEGPAVMLIEGINYIDFERYTENIKDARDAERALLLLNLYSLGTATVQLKDPQGRSRSDHLAAFNNIKGQWLNNVKYEFFPFNGKAPTKGSISHELKQETLEQYLQPAEEIYDSTYGYSRDPNFRAAAHEFIEDIAAGMSAD